MLNFLGEFNFDQFNSSTWLALVSKISESSDSSANYDVSFKGKFNADKLNYENATFKNVQMRDVSYQENIKIKNDLQNNLHNIFQKIEISFTHKEVQIINTIRYTKKSTNLFLKNLKKYKKIYI